MRAYWTAIQIGLGLAVACYVGACSDDADNGSGGNGTTSSGTGGSSTGGGSVGGGDGGLNLGGSDPGCTQACSADLKKVLCDGVLVTECTGDQACLNGICSDDPCGAAEASRSSYGCDYWALRPDVITAVEGSCFAAFVVHDPIRSVVLLPTEFPADLVNARTVDVLTDRNKCAYGHTNSPFIVVSNRLLALKGRY